MFDNCIKLKNLDLSNFNTSNVMNMENMFYGCFELKEIKGIERFNTNKVTNMRGMFEFC